MQENHNHAGSAKYQQSQIDPVTLPEPEHHQIPLDNGLTVHVFPMPWRHEVGITLLVRAGSRFETAEDSGIAHFLEHMIFKGIERIPDPTDLHTYLESLGADMNASTGQETNAYWVTLPPENMQEGFLTFCEMFTHPAFSDLQTERKIILSEMREDENDEGEVINSSILSAQMLWPDHPLGRPILGSRESVNAVTVESLRRFLEQCYTGSNLAIAFFGPVTPDHCVALCKQALGGFPAGSPAELQTVPPFTSGPHWQAVNDRNAQLLLTLSFRTAGYHALERHLLSAIQRVLDDGFASRLQAKLREKQGLAYELWAGYQPFSDTGSFELGASVAPDQLEVVFHALLEQLNQLHTHPPDEAEWTRVHNRWRFSLTSALDHPGNLLERFVSDPLFNVQESFSSAWDHIRHLTPEDIAQSAAQLFKPENMVVTLVGSGATDRIDQLKKMIP
ncbi:MAG: insulinase family protein [Magnetococcales bacterium]|nr:insulinase family protein [Magnetococcales bacterium]